MENIRDVTSKFLAIFFGLGKSGIKKIRTKTSLKTKTFQKKV